MDEAIREANTAAENGDVPVGAVIVCEGEIIGRGHNRKEAAADPTAHAEIEALRDAARTLGNWRLKGCTLFVTMEPCPMCMGALLQARIKTLVFGAWDVNWGACGSRLNLTGENRFNHEIEVIGGIKEAECAALTGNFFREKRNAPL